MRNLEHEIIESGIIGGESSVAESLKVQLLKTALDCGWRSAFSAAIKRRLARRLQPLRYTLHRAHIS
ncbi:MAG: hypothetical protein WCC37_08105, partial [Candidatus Sulfotelmatobacter sp.]